MALGMRVHMVSCHSGYATFYSTVYERSRVSHVYAHIPICTYPRNCILVYMPVAHMHARTDLCAALHRASVNACLLCYSVMFWSVTRNTYASRGPTQRPSAKPPLRGYDADSNYGND